jgi:hypothetical protein
MQRFGLTSQVSLRDERQVMRRWLHTVLLRRAFGGAADTILATIRKVFVGDDFGKSFVKPELLQFPRNAIGGILRVQGKDQQITEELIDTLLSTQFEDLQSFTILALLAPDLDYKNGNFHKDHLHPASAFKKRAARAAAGMRPEDSELYGDTDNWNGILNLRFLDANENKSKKDGSLYDWVEREAKRQMVSDPSSTVGCSGRGLSR